MHGTIYCFNTIGDARIFKAGHTQNELRARLRGYLGPSRPRTIFFCQCVDDSVLAETLMLTLLRQCVSFTQRKDLGNEWFEATVDDAPTLYDHLKKIAYVCALASCARPSNARHAVATREFAAHVNACAGLQYYFERFDAYVQTAKVFSTVEELVHAFESSTACPVLADYVPYTMEQRVAAAARRYVCLV